MIRVIVSHTEENKILAEIKIEHLDPSILSLPNGKYSARIIVDRGAGILGMYQVSVSNFPRKKLNVLDLISTVLAELVPEQLELSGEPDDSTAIPVRSFLLEKSPLPKSDSSNT